MEKKTNKKTKKTWRYYHFTNVYHKWQSYDLWFFRYGVQQTFFLSLWTVFVPLTLLTTKKIKILKNWKKPLEITLFYTSAPKIMIIYMLYCFLDMAHNGFNYFSFWVIFYPFTSLTAPQKSKFRKTEKNPWRYHHFTQVYHKILIICCTVHEIWYVTDVIIFHFGPFFVLLPP